VFDKLLNEVSYQFSRSGGAGGQHVNKTSTKVELRFHIKNSQVLGVEQKELLQLKLANRINSAGELILTCSDSRSQARNKEIVVERFVQLIRNALSKKKVRRISKPTRASIEKRLNLKKIQAQRKQNRKKPSF
jgi:ribosome-associated protein